MTRLRRSVVGALVLALSVCALVTAPAQASRLPLVASGSPSFIGAFARPCSGPAIVSPSDPVGSSGKYRSLVVTGLSGTCTHGLLGLSTVDGSVIDGLGTAVPVVGGGFTVTPTRQFLASSVDPRVFVSGDTWPVRAVWNPNPQTSPLGACAVTVVATGVTTSKACSITAVRADAPWGNTGSRTTNVYVSISAPAMLTDGTERPYLAVNLAAATVPAGAASLADWNWSTAGALKTDNVVAFPGAQCSALPMLEVYGYGWAANRNATIYVQAVENRAGASGLICS